MELSAAIMMGDTGGGQLVDRFKESPRRVSE